jgi:hypothetical protein
MKRLTTNE